MGKLADAHVIDSAGPGWRVPTTVAITMPQARLGPAPLRAAVSQGRGAVRDAGHAGGAGGALPGPAGDHGGMLLLADRNFISFKLWSKAAATRADLCWQVLASFTLKPVTVLADGTYLAQLKPWRRRTATRSLSGSRNTR